MDGPTVAIGLAVAAGLISKFGTVSFGGTSGGQMSRAQVKALVERIVGSYTPGIDPRMVRAIIEIESTRFPQAWRNEPHISDASIGLMQTLHRTALFLYDTYGAKSMARPSDAADLLNPETSVYFGANYLEYLTSYGGGGHSEEWIVRAYNGGPGNAMSTATANYWNKYKAAKAAL